MPSREELYARLVEAGLERYADDLVGLAAVSIRLWRGEPEVAGAAYRVCAVELPCPGGCVVALAGGDFHALALSRDGSVAAWGDNGQAQLGDGTKANRQVPVAVRGLSGIQAIAAGVSHSLALTDEGTLFAWGENRGGQLGDGTTLMRRTPVAIDGLHGVRAVFAGWEVSYAILADGSVVGWGLNAISLQGLVGSPDPPVAVPGLESGVVAVAAGNAHRVALTAGGEVIVWGWQPGAHGSDALRDWAPRRLDLAAEVRAIAAGRDHALALTSEGQVLAWGDNALGRLGVGAGADGRPAPVTGLEGGGVIAIAAGWGRSFALKDDGTVMGWGWNHHGALGDGTLADRPTPVAVRGLRGVRAIAPQAALTQTGAVLAWGGKLPRRKIDAEAGLALGTSKLGGRPDLPHDVAWPRVEGRPMCFVAQIELDALPALDSAALLPTDGLLSFFCAPTELGDAGGGHVLYTKPGTPLVRTDAPAELAADERFAPVTLQPVAELTGLPWQSSQLDQLGLSWEQRKTYGDALGQHEETPVHRVLGHPKPCRTIRATATPARACCCRSTPTRPSE